MISVRRILVPLDFDAKTKRVLDYARLVADGCGASLHLLHVLPYTDGVRPSAAAARHEACERLKTLLTPDDRVRRHATVSCVAGTPAHEICAFAAAQGSDLIVMGTHSHGPAFRMVSGSIAEIVTGAAPCAVLAVKDAGAVAAAPERSGTTVARVS
jgi:nucleotide-binding universal stress UspA family protein